MTELSAHILKDCFTRSGALLKLHQLSRIGGKEIFNEKNSKKNWDVDLDLPKGITARNFDEMLEKAEEEIKNLPLLTLYVPLDLPAAEADRIGSKIRKDYEQDFLLDFRMDPKLIAGCSLVWNGKMQDFSFRKKMLAKHEEIRNLVLD